MTQVETVSVVVVAHNNWPDLELAIVSALQQSHPPLEVLVVDNGSTDGTADEVAKAFGDRVRYVPQDNRMDAGGYNTGIRAARGDFIQLLDGDDCLAPNKIEKQIALFRADPGADIVYSDGRSFLGSPGVARWTDRPVTEYPDMLAALCEAAGNIGGLVPSTALFRRRVFDSVGWFDEAIYSADYDFWFRAANSGCRFRYAPGTVVFLRQWGGQMSRRPMKMLRRQEQTFAKALEYVEDERLKPLLRRHLARGRYWAALFPEFGLTRAEAVVKLREARMTSPQDVNLVMHVAALLALYLPGGRRLIGHRTIRAAARRVANLISGHRAQASSNPL
jgi:glycosyltransferase involved in cell wall biosynthesis